MNESEIKNICRYYKSACKRGYIRVGCYPIISPYKGRYGEGYTIEFPNKCGLPNGAISNTYHTIKYYIKKH
jgi:hypothetical protein